MFLKHVVGFSLLAPFCNVICTVDMNIHQLQMVADHLSQEECRKLAEALHENSLFLQKQVTGENEPDKPCIFLLLRWERTEGNGKTFGDLALRLGQIGRKDLANKLSKIIYKEETDELERTFLDQPFKKLIPKNSFLLAQDDDETDDDSDDGNKKLKPSQNLSSTGLNSWEIAAIVSGSVSGLFLICFLVFFVCGNMIARLFRSYAPDFMVSWVDLVSTQFKWLWGKVKRDYSTHVVGSKQGGREKRRWTVDEMNRNLNNYLNGHINEKDRFYYFHNP